MPAHLSSLSKGRYIVHTRELAPETRSRNTLPGKYPNQYTRRTRRRCWMIKQPHWGMGTKKISQFDWPTGDTSCHGKQISVHTRELAPETDSCNRFTPSYQTSLIWGRKNREQKFFCATYFFARNRWCRRGSFDPGACCSSVLREQAPSCVPALTISLVSRSWCNFQHLHHEEKGKNWRRNLRRFWAHLKFKSSPGKYTNYTTDFTTEKYYTFFFSRPRSSFLKISLPMMWQCLLIMSCAVPALPFLLMKSFVFEELTNTRKFVCFAAFLFTFCEKSGYFCFFISFAASVFLTFFRPSLSIFFFLSLKFSLVDGICWS